MTPAAAPGSAPALSSGPLTGDVVRLEPLEPGHVPGLQGLEPDDVAGQRARRQGGR